MQKAPTWLQSLRLSHLRVFVQVAQEQSFRRAAETLHLSQPAVSDQVRRLERLVGLPLLVRSRGKNRVTLTGPGRLMLEQSIVVLDQLDALAGRMSDAAEEKQARLFIGANVNAFARLLNAINETFRQQYPEIELDMRTDVTPELLRRLRAGEIELAVVLGPLDLPDLLTEAIADSKAILVARPDHRLAGPRLVPFKELGRERLILPLPSALMRKAVENLAGRYRVQLQVDIQATEVEARVHAALQGLGVALVPAEAVASRLEASELVVLNVEAFPLPFQQIVVYRREELSSEGQLFRRCLLAAGPSLPARFPSATQSDPLRRSA